MLRSSRLLHFAAVTVIIAASLLLSPRCGWCRIMGIPDIQKMTLDSDLIAVVEVAGIRQVGTAAFVDSRTGRSKDNDLPLYFALKRS